MTPVRKITQNDASASDDASPSDDGSVQKFCKKHNNALDNYIGA